MKNIKEALNDFNNSPMRGHLGQKGLNYLMKSLISDSNITFYDDEKMQIIKKAKFYSMFDSQKAIMARLKDTGFSASGLLGKSVKNLELNRLEDGELLLAFSDLRYNEQKGGSQSHYNFAKMICLGDQEDELLQGAYLEKDTTFKKDEKGYHILSRKHVLYIVTMINNKLIEWLETDKKVGNNLSERTSRYSVLPNGLSLREKLTPEEYQRIYKLFPEREINKQYIKTPDLIDDLIYKPDEVKMNTDYYEKIHEAKTNIYHL